MRYKTKVRKDLNKVFLCIEENKVFKEDYQMIMIRENHIRGILPVSGKGIENKTIYEYNITGKHSLKKKFDEEKISVEEMRRILGQILEVVDQMEEYLLNPNSILLEPEYIFYEEGEYYFCYFPGEKEDLKARFHVLTEEFIRWTDYQDGASVQVAFYLYKETLQEDYNLESLIKNQEEEEKVEVTREYLEPDCDWTEYQEPARDLLKETDNLWLPVKKFLDQRKRPKWGDWDGIYIDDEEL